jgi:membrane protein implicated in regulation of membrane protease activity
MFELPRVDLSDGVFLVCLLAGGLLLLVSVVVGEVLDAIDLPFVGGGSGIVPPLLAFVALFGAGGLLGRQTLQLPGDQATYLALGVGALGALGTGGLLRLLRRSEAGPEFRIESLVGHTGQAETPIGPGTLGQVTIDAMGGSQRFIASSEVDLAQGRLVRVRAIVGGRLVVEPLDPATPPIDATPTPTDGAPDRQED